MKRFSEQLKKKADTIRLRTAERNELKERIVAYMEYHPLPQSDQRSSRTAIPRGVLAGSARAFRYNRAWVRGVVGLFALFILVVIPAVAEQSLPGDILYPVKTDITEPLRGQLAFSPYAKIEWETTRVERRIAEARLLASEGKLTPQTEASVAKAVQDHASAAQHEIATLRKSNADDAAIAEINLSSALAVQSQVLDTGTTSSSTDGHSIALLAGTVNQVRAAVDASQASSSPSYTKLLKQVELETSNAYTLFNSIKQQASADQMADIKRRLSDIEQKTAAAIALHDGVASSSDQSSSTAATASTTATTTPTASTTAVTASSTGTSTDDAAGTTTPAVASSTASAKKPVAMLRGALIDIRKLISYMTDIDVRANVSIDALIPVTLTDAERIAAIEKELNAAQDIAAHLAAKPLSDEAAAKVNAASSTLAAYIRDTEEALNANDINGAEKSVHQAGSLADDLATIAGFASTTAATVTSTAPTEEATSTATTSNAASTTPVTTASSTKSTTSTDKKQ